MAQGFYESIVNEPPAQASMAEIIALGRLVGRRIEVVEDDQSRLQLVDQLNDKLTVYHLRRMLLAAKTLITLCVIAPPKDGHYGDVFPVYDARALSGNFRGVQSWHDEAAGKHKLGFILEQPYVKTDFGEEKKLNNGVYALDIKQIDTRTVSFTWL